MCSGIDVSLLSGFVILTVKHLPINIKHHKRHHDFKAIHELRIEMDMGLLRASKCFEVFRSMVPFNGKAWSAPSDTVMVQ